MVDALTESPLGEDVTRANAIVEIGEIKLMREIDGDFKLATSSLRKSCPTAAFAKNV